MRLGSLDDIRCGVCKKTGSEVDAMHDALLGDATLIDVVHETAGADGVAAVGIGAAEVPPASAPQNFDDIDAANHAMDQATRQDTAPEAPAAEPVAPDADDEATRVVGEEVG